MARRRLCSPLIDVMAALLALTLTTGCAHPRRPLSLRVTVPSLSALGKLDVGDGRAAARRAQDKINRALKQLENSARRAHGPAGAADQAGTLLGSGTEHATSTTGTMPEPPSSGGSSVVVTQSPNPGLLSASSRSGTGAPGASDPGNIPLHENLRALLVACGLIAAILWLPRRLDVRKHVP
jgi:hypothetical protein